TVVPPEVVDLDDVGVLKVGDHFGLRQEPQQVLLAGLSARQDHLQRHHAVESDLPCPVNHPHPAATQLAQQFVAGDAGDSRGGGRFTQQGVHALESCPLPAELVEQLGAVLAKFFRDERLALFFQLLTAQQEVQESRVE